VSQKASYLESEGEYLLMLEDGTSKILKSKEEFDKYLTENNCDLIN
tara:strand:+ start:472 stop:609 length:138 start_codon:yes stop_codon:yes gene_type:complete